MGKTEVVDRAGNRWVVRRLWAPRWTRVDVGKRFSKLHRRKRGRPNDDLSPWWDLVDIPIEDISVITAIAVIIGLLLVLWFAVIPLLLVIVDVVVVSVLLLASVLARVFLRRPWVIVATRDDGVEIQREVVGWRASRDEIAALLHEIELGIAEAVPEVNPP